MTMIAAAALGMAIGNCFALCYHVTHCRRRK